MAGIALRLNCFTVYTLATTKALLLYAAMNKIVAGHTVLEEMKRHYQDINNWVSVQRRAGLLIYPRERSGRFYDRCFNRVKGLIKNTKKPV